MEYRRSVLTGAWGALALVLLVTLIQFAGGIGRSVGWPGAMSPTGGVVSVLASRPDLWFHPIEQAPFFPTTYPPLYPAIVHAVWRLTGGDVFVVGRAVTQLAIVATALLIAGLVVDATDDRRAGAVAGALYMFSPLVGDPVVHLRVDYLAVAFGVAALYWYATRTGRRAVVGAVLLTVAAAWTKQAVIAPAAAIAVVAVLDREYRSFFGFSAGTGAVGLGILGGATVLTGGRTFEHLVSNSAAFPWHATRAVTQAIAFVQIHGLMFLVGIGGVIWSLRQSDRRLLLPVYTAIALELAIVTAGRQGAWTGYYVPALAGMAVLAGYMIADSRGGLRITVLVLLVLQATVFATAITPQMYDRSAQATVADRIERTEGPVLSETAGVVVESDSQEPYEAIMMKYLAEGDRWDESRLTERIATQEYSVIVTRVRVDKRSNWNPTRWTPAVGKSIAEHYELEGTVGGYHIYVPSTSVKSTRAARLATTPTRTVATRA